MPETGNQNRTIRCLPGVYSHWQRSPVGGYLADAARTPSRRNDYSGGCDIRYSKPISGKPHAVADLGA